MEEVFRVAYIACYNQCRLASDEERNLHKRTCNRLLWEKARRIIKETGTELAFLEYIMYRDRFRLIKI